MPASRRHPGFVVSVAAGVVGVALLLAGALVSSDGVFLAGVIAVIIASLSPFHRPTSAGRRGG